MHRYTVCVSYISTAVMFFSHILNILHIFYLEVRISGPSLFLCLHNMLYIAQFIIKTWLWAIRRWLFADEVSARLVPEVMGI